MRKKPFPNKGGGWGKMLNGDWDGDGISTTPSMINS